MKLSVIIVSYNVKYFLEQCLCSVQQAIKNIDAEVIVIDNCSTDGSVDYLQQKNPRVQFISNTRNEGFAKANNTALRKCSGAYVLFLNPDTIIPENILQQCIQFLQTQTDAGALGVRMLDGTGTFLPESKRTFPSPGAAFYKLSGLSAIFPGSKHINKYALGNIDEHAIHAVDVLCGAFLMADRKLLLELNGFDEAFFMYGEDIDLCYRLQQIGKQNYYLGNLSIIHFKGESSGADQLKHTRMFYNAMRVFVQKHYTATNALLLQIPLQAGIFIRAAVSFAGKPIRSFFYKTNVSLRSSSKNICLIGDAAATTTAKNIILKNKLQEVRKGSLMIEKKETWDNQQDYEIIFCIGTLSYKESIQITSTNAKRNNYKWHGWQTESITGSSNKRLTGSMYHS